MRRSGDFTVADCRACGQEGVIVLENGSLAEHNVPQRMPTPAEVGASGVYRLARCHNRDPGGGAPCRSN